MTIENLLRLHGHDMTKQVDADGRLVFKPREEQPSVREQVAGAFRSALEAMTQLIGITPAAAGWTASSIEALVESVFQDEDVQMHMSAAAVMADITQPIGMEP